MNSPENPNNCFPFQGEICMEQRNQMNRHGSGLVWFYGLSGCGKSTLAHSVEAYLHSKGIHCCVLDGDNIRNGLNRDLGLSPKDRRENIRRVAEVSKIMVNAGILVLAAFITPYEDTRRQVRELMTGMPYYEIYLQTPVDECIRRDPKGLYARALAGKIKEFTGISAPFEKPQRPDCTIDTSQLTIEECTENIVEFFNNNRLILSYDALTS